MKRYLIMMAIVGAMAFTTSGAAQVSGRGKTPVIQEKTAFGRELTVSDTEH